MLYRREVEICEGITLCIPTVGEIISHDAGEHYEMVNLIISTPSDMMVQLDDLGIDFTTITEYELFFLFFGALREKDTSLIFKNLDLSKFEVMVKQDDESIVLYDAEDDIMIDEKIYRQIANKLRAIYHIKKNNKKPANAEARAFMIERARKKQKREARKNKNKETSALEDLIISLVNTEQFNYRYDEVLDITIYQFNSSVHQIIDKIKFDNMMIGCYAGTVDMQKLNQEELNWMK